MFFGGTQCSIKLMGLGNRHVTGYPVLYLFCKHLFKLTAANKVAYRCGKFQHSLINAYQLWLLRKLLLLNGMQMLF